MHRSSRRPGPKGVPAPADRVHAAAFAAVEVLEDRRLMSISLVTAAPGGAAGNGDSGSGSGSGFRVASSVSDDGRFVAFISKATNLVANDNNGQADVFVRDLQAGTTTLVSATPAGASGNGESGAATGPNDNGVVISGNGRFVAFVSEASDLVANDNNGGQDLFVRDLQTGQLTLVTVNAAGTGSAVSPSSVTPEGIWGQPAISDDGRWVAFSTDANDLVAGQENDDVQPDTFVRDLQGNVTTQLTKPAPGETGGGNGSFGQSISADGRYVAFVSSDTIIPGLDGVFEQVYVYDTTAQTTALVSVAADGTSRGNLDSSEPRVSADGRHVAFLSEAKNLVSGFVDNTPNGAESDLYVRDLDTNNTLLASHAAGSNNTGGNQQSFVGSISANGRFVAFYSDASNLTSASDTNESSDAFFFDAQTGTTTLLSVNTSGAAAERGAQLIEAGYEEPPAMSDDGRRVAFVSASNDLVANDPAVLLPELFVRDTQANTTRRVLDPSNVPGGATAFVTTENPAFSGDGSRLAFAGSGPGLPGGDLGVGEQIYADDGTPAGPGPGPGGGTADLSGAIVATLPSAVVGGEKAKAKVAVVVTNSGTGVASGPVTVTLFVSQSGSVTGATEVANATKNLKLKPGRSKAIKLKVRSFPAVPDGNYSVVARVESGGSVDVVTAGQQVTIAAPFVNLTGAFAGGTPSSLTRGRKSTVAVTVTNSGNVIASGAVRVDLGASADGTPGSAADLGSVTKNLKLKPGASKTVKVKFTVPDSLAAGTFVADVDAGGAVTESNESDNTVVAASPFTVT